MSNDIRILLIEDSATDGELTIRALGKHGLAERVTWLRDGAQALDYLYRNGAYAERAEIPRLLILLDLKLPKVGGLRLLERLKADPDKASIPIIVLTSSAEDRDLEEAYRLGVNSYLVKPLEYQAFMDVVSHAGWYWVLNNRLP
ncbi:response regulator [Pseudomonas stutzeri]|uniref:response regulator n=1 Tax=Stutzerimonas stutzeri TaxID=316 RepID=UPI002109527E|nr:response regulator [Stutzerimonas stutzeri]